LASIVSAALLLLNIFIPARCYRVYKDGGFEEASTKNAKVYQILR